MRSDLACSTIQCSLADRRAEAVTASGVFHSLRNAESASSKYATRVIAAATKREA